jgi:hypothetical protein
MPLEVAVIVALPAVAGAVYRAVIVPLAAVPDEGDTWPVDALTVTAAFATGAVPAPTRISTEVEPPQLIVLEAVWTPTTVGTVAAATPEQTVGCVAQNCGVHAAGFCRQ